MRIWTLLLSLVLLVNNSKAQTALAKLKFEDAEQAFNNGDYRTAITSLKEAEKLFGKTNPPIQHLLILSQYKLLEGKDVFMDIASPQIFNELYKNCQLFLQKNSDDERLTGKYKEVYKISEQLKSDFPVARIQLIGELKQRPNPQKLYQLYCIYNDLGCSANAGYYRYEAATNGYIPARVLNMRDAKEKDMLPQQYKPLMKLVSEGDAHAAQVAASVYYSDSALAVAFDPSATTVEIQVKKAVAMYEKAAAGGDITAMTSLGILYRNGAQGGYLAPDSAKAMNWFTKAIANGSILAAYFKGGWYEKNNDYKQAMNIYKNALEMGGSATLFDNLARNYQYGWGVEADYAEALKYYKLALVRGSVSGYANIAFLYSIGGPNLTQNDFTALEWYRKGAENGDAYSMSCIAKAYLKGRGVAMHLQEAEKWFTKAAHAGRVNDMMILGENYTNRDIGFADEVTFCYKVNASEYEEHRLFCSKSDSLAAYWFMQAAKKGNKNAAAQTGMFYLAGLFGIKEDEKTAMEYFSASGDTAAYTRACFMIGLNPRLYKTPERSIYFLTKAAEHGHGYAMFNLSNRYKKGYNGYPKDKDKARFWEQKYNATK
ncbi:tetratricopeptide repeat protein [Filimonas effusa]|nr:tetratricopeptide repeat protein [Filimonas effusa]